jgi:hypothetical protein
MLYAETEALPGRWRGTGWVWWWNSRPTSREAAVKLPSPPPPRLFDLVTGVGTTAVLLFTDYFQGMREKNGTSEWGEAMMMAAEERRDPTQRDKRLEERETPRETQRHRDNPGRE